MTVKCTFCNDAKQEPGIPGPCVWCEEVEPVTLGTVTRYAESCGEGGGVVEHASGQFVEFKDYDAALGREAALREELAAAKRPVSARRDFDYDRGFTAGSAEVETFRIERDALQQRLTVAEQRAAEVEVAFEDSQTNLVAGMSTIRKHEQRIGALEVVLRHFASCADVRQVGTSSMDFVAALKPAAEQTKICPNCKVCMGSPDFPENCLINGVKP